MTLPVSIFHSETFNDDYIKNHLKNVSWIPSDDFEMFGAADDFQYSVRSTKEFENALKSTGKTKNSPDPSEQGMWRRYDNTKVEHAFYKIYHKLACCLGKRIDDPFIVKILKDYIKDDSYDEITDINTVSYSLYFDTSGDNCTINGVDYKDTNSIGSTMNQNCLRLVQQLVAFLNKYDPNNLLLESVGACVNNGNLPEDIANIPAVGVALNGNRACSEPICQDATTSNSAFRTDSERQPCSSTICIAKIASDNSTGDGNVKAIVENPKLTQNCGAVDKKSIQDKAIAEDPSYEPNKPTELSKKIDNTLSSRGLGSSKKDSSKKDSSKKDSSKTDDDETDDDETDDNFIEGIDNMVLFGGIAIFFMFMSSSSSSILAFAAK